MNEQELKDWLKRKMRIEFLPPVIWEQLEGKGLIQPALPSYSEVEREDLLDYAKSFYRVWQSGKSDSARQTGHDPLGEDTDQQESFEFEPGDYERERATAYSEYLAKLAADDRLVRSYRKRQLGAEDKVLAAQVAEELLAEGIVLQSITRQLSSGRAYPWNENQAAWFLLTGEVPEVPPVFGGVSRRWGRVHNYGAITLTVEPWVSADIVYEFFLELQRKLLGRNKRQVSPRNLALFRFIINQVQRIHIIDLRERRLRQESTGSKGWGVTTTLKGGPSWRKMMERWNDELPENHAWRYQNARNFARDFRNAEWQIANPVRS